MAARYITSGYDWYDTFTDAGTGTENLSAHTSDSSHTWSYSGAQTIIFDKDNDYTYCNTGSLTSLYPAQTSFTGTVDWTVEIELTWPASSSLPSNASSDYAGMFWRFVDFSNFYVNYGWRYYNGSGKGTTDNRYLITQIQYNGSWTTLLQSSSDDNATIGATALHFNAASSYVKHTGATLERWLYDETNAIERVTQESVSSAILMGTKSGIAFAGKGTKGTPEKVDGAYYKETVSNDRFATATLSNTPTLTVAGAVDKAGVAAISVSSTWLADLTHYGSTHKTTNGIFRITNYSFATDDAEFTGSTYELTLENDLLANYYVIVNHAFHPVPVASDSLTTGNQGCMDIVVSTDPFGTGDLGISSGNNKLGFSRNDTGRAFAGSVTVVECLQPTHPDGFTLKGVYSRTVSGNTSATPITTATVDLDRVMPWLTKACSYTLEEEAFDVNAYFSNSTTLNVVNYVSATAPSRTYTFHVVQYGSNWSGAQTPAYTASQSATNDHNSEPLAKGVDGTRTISQFFGVADTDTVGYRQSIHKGTYGLVEHIGNWAGWANTYGWSRISSGGTTYAFTTYGNTLFFITHPRLRLDYYAGSSSFSSFQEFTIAASYNPNVAAPLVYARADGIVVTVADKIIKQRGRESSNDYAQCNFTYIFTSDTTYEIRRASGVSQGAWNPLTLIWDFSGIEAHNNTTGRATLAVSPSMDWTASASLSVTCTANIVADLGIPKFAGTRYSALDWHPVRANLYGTINEVNTAGTFVTKVDATDLGSSTFEDWAPNMFYQLRGIQIDSSAELGASDQYTGWTLSQDIDDIGIISLTSVNDQSYVSKRSGSATYSSHLSFTQVYNQEQAHTSPYGNSPAIHPDLFRSMDCFSFYHNTSNDFTSPVAPTYTPTDATKQAVLGYAQYYPSNTANYANLPFRYSIDTATGNWLVDGLNEYPNRVNADLVYHRVSLVEFGKHWNVLHLNIDNIKNITSGNDTEFDTAWRYFDLPDYVPVANAFPIHAGSWRDACSPNHYWVHVPDQLQLRLRIGTGNGEVYSNKLGIRHMGAQDANSNYHISVYVIWHNRLKVDRTVVTLTQSELNKAFTLAPAIKEEAFYTFRTIGARWVYTYGGATGTPALRAGTQYRIKPTGVTAGVSLDMQLERSYTDSGDSNYAFEVDVWSVDFGAILDSGVQGWSELRANAAVIKTHAAAANLTSSATVTAVAQNDCFAAASISSTVTKVVSAGVSFFIGALALASVATANVVATNENLAVSAQTSSATLTAVGISEVSIPSTPAPYVIEGNIVEYHSLSSLSAHTVDYPQGMSPGDLVICTYMAAYNASTVVPTITGWTTLSFVNHTAVFARKVIGNEGSTFTVNPGGSRYIQCLVYLIKGGVMPQADVAAEAQGVSSAPALPTYNNSYHQGKHNCLWLTVYSWNNVSHTSYPTGWSMGGAVTTQSTHRNMAAVFKPQFAATMDPPDPTLSGTPGEWEAITLPILPQYLLDKTKFDKNLAYSNDGGYAFAWSVRRLRAGYVGPCMQVRRSSDQAVQNIYFDGEHLDESALLSFVGGGDGTVVKWYDQTGYYGTNANAEALTTSNEPRIVSSGVIDKINGRPAIYTDGSSDYLRTPGTFWADEFWNMMNYETTYHMVCQQAAASTQNTSFSWYVSSTEHYVIQGTYSDNNLYFNAGNATGRASFVYVNPSVWDDQQQIVTLYTNKGATQHHFDINTDRFYTDTVVSGTPGVTTTDYIYLFVLHDNSTLSRYFQGYHQEIIVYNGTDVAGVVQSDANSYYNLTSVAEVDGQTPIVAYGSRKLVKNYTGDALRAHRVGDSQVLDIPFAGHYVDVAYLVEFCGQSGDVRLATWYDQSGNGYDVTQGTASLMPVLAQNGVLSMIDPRNFAPKFTALNSQRLTRAGLAADAILGTNYVNTYHAYVYSTNPSNNSGIAGIYRSSSETTGIYATWGNVLYYDYGNTSGRRTSVTSASDMHSTQHHLLFTNNGTSAYIKDDNTTLVTDSSLSGTPTVSNSDTLEIGSYADWEFDGYIAEVIIYDAYIGTDGAYWNTSQFFQKTSVHSGVLAASGSTTLTAIGAKDIAAQCALSSSITQTAVAQSESIASCAVTSSATMTTVAQNESLAYVPLTTDATMTVVAQNDAFGSIPMSTSATVTAVAQNESIAVSAQTSSAILSVLGGVTRPAQLAESSTVTLTVLGSVDHTGVSAPSSSVTQTVTPVADWAGKSAQTVSGVLAAVAQNECLATSALTTSATLTGDLTLLQILFSASLTSSGTVTAVAQNENIASASGLGESSWVAVAQNEALSQAALSSTVTLTAVAQNESIATSALTSDATVTAVAQNESIAQFSQSSVATLLASCSIDRTGVVSESSTAVVAAVAENVAYVAELLATSATVIVPVAVERTGVSPLTSSAIASINATNESVASFGVTVNGLVSAIAQSESLAASAITSTVDLVVAGSVDKAGVSSITSGPILTVIASGDFSATVAISSDAILAAIAQNESFAASAIDSTATLTAVGSSDLAGVVSETVDSLQTVVGAVDYIGVVTVAGTVTALFDGDIEFTGQMSESVITTQTAFSSIDRAGVVAESSVATLTVNGESEVLGTITISSGDLAGYSFTTPYANWQLNGDLTDSGGNAQHGSQLGGAMSAVSNRFGETSSAMDTLGAGGSNVGVQSGLNAASWTISGFFRADLAGTGVRTLFSNDTEGGSSNEIIRPTDSFNGATWTNEANIYDADTGTAATLSNPTGLSLSVGGTETDETVAAWQTKQNTWTSATIYCRAEKPAGSNDTVEILVTDQNGVTKHTLVAATSGAIALNTYSATLNSADWGGAGFPNISNIRVRVNGVKNQGPDNVDTSIYEVWVEGAASIPAGGFVCAHNGTNLYLSRAGTTTDVSTTDPLVDGHWHHVAAKYESGTLKLYVDGSLADSAVISVASSNYPLYLGAGHIADGTGPDEYFDGDIDDIKYYTTNISDTEISELYWPTNTSETSLQVQLVPELNKIGQCNASSAGTAAFNAVVEYAGKSATSTDALVAATGTQDHRGVVLLLPATTLSALSSVDRTGVVSESSTATLTAIGDYLAITGQATLTAASTLTSDSGYIHFVALALPSAATLTTVPINLSEASAVLTTTATDSLSGVIDAIGQVSETVTTSLTVAGSVDKTGVVSVASEAVIPTVTVNLDKLGKGLFAAQSTQTGTISIDRAFQAALLGSATFNPSSVNESAAIAGLTGSGSVSAVAAVEYVAAAQVLGVATVLAAPESVSYGAAVVAGTSDLQAIGAYIWHGAVSLTSDAVVAGQSSMDLAGSSALISSATGIIVAQNESLGQTSASGNSTVIAVGRADFAAVAPLTSAGDLTSLSEVTNPFAASISAVGVVSASAVLDQIGMSTVTGEAFAAAVAQNEAYAQAAIAGNAVIVPVATSESIASASVDATSTLAAFVSIDRYFTTDQPSAAIVSFTAQNESIASMAISGQSTLAVSGSVDKTGVAAITSSATAAFSASNDSLATASLSATSTVAAASAIDRTGVVSESSTVTLTSTGTYWQYANSAITSAATVGASSVLDVAGFVSASTGATLAALGNFVDSAGAIINGTSAIAAFGSVDKTGVMIESVVSLATADATNESQAVMAVQSAATLSVAGSVDKTGVVNAASTSTLSATGTYLQQPTISILSTSTLSASGRGEFVGAASISSTATIVADYERIRTLQGNLSSVATAVFVAFMDYGAKVASTTTTTVNATAENSNFASANLTSGPVFAIVATNESYASSAGIGESSIVAVAENQNLAQVDLHSEALISAIGTNDSNAAAVFVGESTLAAIATNDAFAQASLVATSSVSAVSQSISQAATNLIGSSDQIARGVVTAVGATSVSSTVTANYTAFAIYVGVSQQSSQATLTASCSIDRTCVVAVSSAAQKSATAHLDIGGAGQLAGASSQDALAFSFNLSSAVLPGLSTANFSAGLIKYAAVAGTAEVTLTASSSIDRNVQSAISGTSSSFAQSSITRSFALSAVSVAQQLVGASVEKVGASSLTTASTLAALPVAVYGGSTSLAGQSGILVGSILEIGGSAVIDGVSIIYFDANLTKALVDGTWVIRKRLENWTNVYSEDTWEIKKRMVGWSGVGNVHDTWVIKTRREI